MSFRYDEDDYDESYFEPQDDPDELMIEEDGQFYIINEDDYWAAEDATWD